MKAKFKVDETTKNIEITVGEYKIERVGDRYLFSNLPITRHIFLGANSNGFFVNVNSAVLRGQDVDDYYKELKDVNDVYYALEDLLGTEEYKKALEGDSKKKDSKPAVRVPAWLRR